VSRRILQPRTRGRLVFTALAALTTLAAPLAHPALASAAPNPIWTAVAHTRADDPKPLHITYGARAGTERAKTFVLEQQLTMQSLKLETDGIPQTIQRPLDLSSKLEIRARDALRAVDGAQPTLFSRAFDAFALHVDVHSQGTDGKPRAETVDATSVFAGTSVLFTWVPKDKSFGKCYEAREANEEFLPRLRADFELRAFLPQRDVKPGDEWTVDAARLVDVLSPFGDLPLRFTKNADTVPPRSLALGIGGPLDAVFESAQDPAPAKAALPKGGVKVRLESVTREDDADIANFAIDYQVEFVRDQTQLARDWLSPLEIFDGLSVSSAEVRWDSRGRGSIAWDLSAGTWKHVELAGTQGSTAVVEYLRAGKATRQTTQFSGSLKLDVTAKAVAAKPADAAPPK
jgi:hypothetical protein